MLKITIILPGNHRGGGFWPPLTDHTVSYDFSRFLPDSVVIIILQRLPNCKELRSMDCYIQILCRFQKSKQKVLHCHYPVLKITLYSPKRRFFSSFGGDFSLLRSDGGGSFRLHFWNLHKICI